jgi:hypothetical protein
MDDIEQVVTNTREVMLKEIQAMGSPKGNLKTE